jgi:hypothetical protein
MCDRWANSFPTFLADMGKAPTDKHEIEREEVNGHYEPDNCIWATHTAQMRNTSRNRLVTFRGVTRCLSEWCEILGVHYQLVYDRLKLGWDSERAFTEPRH